MRLRSIRTARPYRRAILIYCLTIVLPVVALLWLGLQSFERQREALAGLTAEKLERAFEARSVEAATAAFSDRSHLIAAHFFRFENGELVDPVLRAPLPRLLPPEFEAAERLELRDEQINAALGRYRELVASSATPGLALSRVARCLVKLGRRVEAQTIWREIAAKYPDERDLSNRPFGIVAAIEAGDTRELAGRIMAGRWQLSADHAEHFLSELSAGASSPYLEEFSFARRLVAGFHPPGDLQPGQVRSMALGSDRVFYRADVDGGPGRVTAFRASRPWLADLRDRLPRELGVTDEGSRALRFYAGAIATVSLLLVAGVVLLVRDTSRETRLNQLRAEFVSGVSHELKTPITLLRLYGETLVRQDQLQEEQKREFYRIITRESARLGRLVDQILAFSRVERGELEYELREGDVAPTVAGVVDDYRDWLEHAGFTVQPNLTRSLPVVRFDPIAVSQAVVNLLDNAAKYSGSSKHIAIRLAAVNGDVTVEVEDYGIGIPREQQSRIFNRFYRAAEGTGKGGYGLGLFMVRHIMTVHGGRVEVESEPGRGSTFRLVFPGAAA